MTERQTIELPSSGAEVPVRPFDTTDPQDAQELLNLLLDVCVKRVDIDGFDHPTARQMTVMDVCAVVDAVMPTQDQGDDP